MTQKGYAIHDAQRLRVTRALTITLYGTSALILLVLFARLGNTHEPDRFGTSVLGWLVSQWCSIGSESSHGFFIPLVSGYMLWRNRDALKSAIAQARVDWRAVGVIGLALALYWCGVRAQQPRLGVVSLILLSWALPWLLYGPTLARMLMIPCAYLTFAIPMGFLNSATLPLRLIATSTAVVLLQGLGFGVVRHGTAILSVPLGRFALDVAEACSGLRSLVALCALIAAYAYLAHRANWQRWALFLCAVPIAIVGNVARVMFLVLIALRFGTERTLEVAHDYSGYLVFAVAVLLMVTLSRQLERIGRNVTT